jgi:EAL domain-containing protein (putative c-di-GMP-specific phosphodiesterase class I)
MTTTLDSVGYLDYAAFGVTPEDLRSLRALGTVWRTALTRASEGIASNGMFDEFLECSAELPLLIADIDWQRLWMQSWNKLSSRGFSLADMFSLFNQAVACCEADLFGDRQQVGRIELKLFAILRRSVVAAISCAIELREEARALEVGLPGEFAAMQSLREMAATGQQVAVLSVSMVNEWAYAHLSAGDLHSIPSLLTEQLTGLLRPKDRAYVGHEGEWLLLLDNVSSLALPALAASQIQREFTEPLALASGRNVVLDVAIGAAMMPDHGRNPEEVIQAARLARRSLHVSNEPFAMFDEAMKQAWQERHELSSELRLAMRHETLMLYLQPQIDMASGQCFGAELLLRWQRADGAWVRPELVIEIIEENGWRNLFTDWLIRTALRLSTELDTAGVKVALSLNLTAGDLLDADLPELVAQCLETWRLPASRFTFELTESAMMGDRDRGLAVMQKLRALGVRLALDDFGTGYSSLSYLATLPLNEIKIDRSFIVGMSGSTEGLRIVRAIIDLTRDLGMRSLAEGVETLAQCDQLIALGCNDAQGFLYGRAMQISEFIDWFNSRQP